MAIYLLEKSENITQKQIRDALHLPKSTVHSIFLNYNTLHLKLVSTRKKILHLYCGWKKFLLNIFKETNQFEENVLSALEDTTCPFLIETTEKLSDIIKNEVAKIHSHEA